MMKKSYEDNQGLMEYFSPPNGDELNLHRHYNRALGLLR